MFLNSERRFDGEYAVDCGRIPCLPQSSTGLTVFSFSQFPRMRSDQLVTFRAKKMGDLPPAVAREVLEIARDDPVLTGAERRIVITALDLISDINA